VNKSASDARYSSLITDSGLPVSGKGIIFAVLVLIQKQKDDGNTH
jgi:hypothetical protein